MNIDNAEKYTPHEWLSNVYPLLAAKVREYTDRGGPDECWAWTRGHHEDGYGMVNLPAAEFGQHRGTRVSRALMILRIGKELDPATQHALHSCDCPGCCNPRHIRIGTPQENVGDRENRGRRTAPKGEAHGSSKLTEAYVSQIRARYAAGGVSQRALATEFGIAQSHLWRILHGESWTEISV